MVAPIIIACIIALYYGGIALVFAIGLEVPMWLRGVLMLGPLAIVAVLIYVTMERIKEIRSGEEDDLSKY